MARTWMVMSLTLVLTGALCGRAARADDAIDFGRDVQPLFKAHCHECHGPKQQKNGFRLNRRRDALRGGTITMIGPGNSGASRLDLRPVMIGPGAAWGRTRFLVSAVPRLRPAPPHRRARRSRRWRFDRLAPRPGNPPGSRPHPGASREPAAGRRP